MESPQRPQAFVPPPTPLSPDRQRRLALDLRARLQQEALDTETPSSEDLHVLMLETLGVLACQLGSIEGEPSEPATAAAHAAFDRIAAFCAGRGSDFVLIDGSPWIRSDDLSGAGAQDAVYALDPASGALRFGDGVHGRRPPSGARIVHAYRYGAGAGDGDVGKDANTISLAPLRRPRFFAGQLLRAEDFTLEQEYQRSKQRLLNRRLHGWGIVDGLEVEIAGTEAVVCAGFALDRSGREILVEREARVPLILSKKKTELSLRYVERETDPVPCIDGDGGLEHSRVVEEHEFALDSKDPARVPLGRLVRRGGKWRLERKFKRRRVR